MPGQQTEKMVCRCESAQAACLNWFSGSAPLNPTGGVSHWSVWTGDSTAPEQHECVDTCWEVGVFFFPISHVLFVKLQSLTVYYILFLESGLLLSTLWNSFFNGWNVSVQVLWGLIKKHGTEWSWFSYLKSSCRVFNDFLHCKWLKKLMSKNWIEQFCFTTVQTNITTKKLLLESFV